MDVVEIWKIAKIVLGFGALVVLALTMVAVFRFRGIWHWRRSLREEIETISREIEETAAGSRKQALALVLQTCRQVKGATSADLQELSRLMEYIRSIAACYHPDSERPELQVKIGRFLNTGRLFIARLDRILSRPGFKKLQRVKIRHIRQALDWYGRLRCNKIVRLVQRLGGTIKNIYWLRLVIIPDLFTRLAYFSNRLTVLILAKCLLTDIYLFVGKIGVDAFEDTEENYYPVADVEDLEKTLEEINLIEPPDIVIDDSQILTVRDRLVGLNRLILAAPGFADLKGAIKEAAEIIAAKYFPAADRPLEEAALGPLLKRSRSWLNTLCDSEKLPIIKKFYGVKLMTLYDMKSFSNGQLFEQIKALAIRGRDVYRLVKWPLRAYRWLKKTSPVQMTLGLGWVIVKKSFIGLVFRTSFDTACKELEDVYRQSI